MVLVQSEVICYVIAVAFITCPSVTTGQNSGGRRTIPTGHLRVKTLFNRGSAESLRACHMMPITLDKLLSKSVQ